MTITSPTAIDQSAMPETPFEGAADNTEKQEAAIEQSELNNDLAEIGTETAATQEAKPGRSLEHAIRDSGDDKTTTEQTEPYKRFDDPGEAADASLTELPAAADTASSPKNSESVDKALRVEEEDDNHALTCGEGEISTHSENSSQNDTIVTDIQPLSASISPAQKEEPDNLDPGAADDKLPDGLSITSSTVDDTSQSTILTGYSQLSFEQLGEDVNKSADFDTSFGVSSLGKVKAAEPTSSPKDITTTIHQDNLGLDLDHSQNGDSHALQLLEIEDDITQYDGDELWRGMMNRCIYYTNNEIDHAAAFMSLQRLRIGRADAKTELRKLCELFKYNEDACLPLREFLGLLQRFKGTSLLQPPFNSEKRTTPFTKKPHESCLTCIHKGRICYGTDTVGLRCRACHEDNLRKHTELTTDECFFPLPHLGILNWQNVMDYYGLSNDAEKGLKRKATDNATQIEPKKRNRKKKTITAHVDWTACSFETQMPPLGYIRTNWGVLPQHLPTPSVDVRERGLLPSFRSKVLVSVLLSYKSTKTFGPVPASFSSFKSVKSCLMFRAFFKVRELSAIKAFTDRPRYVFSIQDAKWKAFEPLSEEDLIRIDREIRAGDWDYYAQEDIVFKCEVSPPSKPS